MLASWVEKPPSDMAENAWQMASKGGIPARINAPMQAAEIPAYTSHSALAVSVMRGVSLASFTGPGVSARYICMPPTPSNGRIATASTMMPMPPSQCSAWRHRFTACGRLSTLSMTVEPVVDSPDMASK